MASDLELDRDGPQSYVLVHGAWHGGWCWRDVSASLRARGHVVYEPTLTGLADQRDLLSLEVDLERHVADVVSVFEEHDLERVHLVGWSYGGLVVTGVLARVPERIRAMTYLDAFLPRDGESVQGLIGGAAGAGLAKLAEKGVHLEPPDPAEAWNITDERVLARARPLLSAQPVRTLTQPVRALASWPEGIAYAYLRCTGSESEAFDESLERARREPLFETAVAAEGHAILLTHPEKVVALLDPQG